MSRFATALAALLLIGVPLGCSALAAIWPIITQIVSIVTEASEILEAIESVADKHFHDHPGGLAEKEYREALISARLSLSEIMRETQKGEDVDREKVDQAFEVFKDAYRELQEILMGQGLLTAQGALKVRQGVEPIQLPEPAALMHRSYWP